MQTKESQPEGKQIMLEMRFTKFPALTIDLMVYNEDQCLIIFVTYHIKNCFLLSVISFIFDILRHITTFSNSHSVFFVVMQNDIIPEIWSSDITFNVACELSQPMGKTEFSSTAKNRTYSVT